MASHFKSGGSVPFFEITAQRSLTELWSEQSAVATFRRSRNDEISSVAAAGYIGPVRMSF